MLCPNCGSQLPDISRFCPICGTVLRPEAVNATRPVAPPAVVPALNVPEESFLNSFSGNKCGKVTVAALKVFAIVLACLVTLAGLVFSVILFTMEDVGLGMLMIPAAFAAGFLVYIPLHVALVQYENISIIARNSETQLRISAAQLELVNRLVCSQREDTEISRQTVELLKVIEGGLFDSAKQREAQLELLRTVAEKQKETAEHVESVGNSVQTLSGKSDDASGEMKSWRAEFKSFSENVSGVLTRLSERIRDAIVFDQARKGFINVGNAEVGSEVINMDQGVISEDND